MTKNLRSAGGGEAPLSCPSPSEAEQAFDIHTRNMKHKGMKHKGQYSKKREK